MKKQQPSLAFRLYLIISLIAVGILTIFMITYLYAVSALRTQVFRTNQATLSMYSDLVGTSFYNAERFLSGFAYNDPDVASLQSDDTLARYLALSREQQKLEESLPSHSGIDGFFFFAPRHGVFCSSSQSWVDSTEHKALQAQLQLDLQDGELAPDGSGKWESYQAGGEYYLVRIILHSGVYVGCWVNVETLLMPLQETPLGQDGGVYLFEPDGTLLADGTGIEGIDGYIPSASSEQYDLVGGKGDYLAVSWENGEGYYFSAFISDASIRSGMSGIYRMIILTVILLAALFLLLYTAMRRMFIEPMGKLVSAIQRLRDGELGVTVQEAGNVREFSEVNASFNDMSSRIQQLTISVYEQKLKRQQIYLEYLKQQITPHFYINCLNTIYSMAGLGKNDLVRQLSKELSQHLRYTMNSQDTVRLGKELDHVRNYIAMTALRYPDTLQCSIEAAPGSEKALVPPLVLQSFVENTVKYEVVMGEPMEINIRVEKYRRGGAERIHICIWDTGGGYGAEALARIQREASDPSDDTSLGDGTKVGISNTIQRLRILFGEDMRIRYSNRPGAGAQCDIFIPYKTEEDLL